MKHSPPGAVTLMYHRVNPVDTNPWGICISPKNFEKQICLLAQNFNVISIDKLVAGISAENLTLNSVCVTFDDAYEDNYIYAKPILEKYNCPATFFIPTNIINRCKPFWWDELEMIFLHSKRLPGQLSLRMGGEVVSVQLTENVLSREQWLLHKKWKWHHAPTTDRCKIFLFIWTKLTALGHEELDTIMNELKKWSCCAAVDGFERSPMNRKQLHELSENKLFSLGMHTHTHCDLSQQKREVQLKEITACKGILKKKFNIESLYLSYPFGRYNDDTLQIAKKLKLEACFTTKAAKVYGGSDKLLLGRYQPFNWPQETFRKKLDNWLAKREDNFITAGR